MRKSRFTEAQIIKILQEGEAGAKVEDLCRRHEISRDSCYRWKQKFGEWVCPHPTAMIITTPKVMILRMSLAPETYVRGT